MAAGAYPRLQHGTVTQRYEGTWKKPGGVIKVLVVSNRCCNPGHATVKHRFCSLDTTAGADAACDVIGSAVANLQTQRPSAFPAITAAVNHVSVCHISSVSTVCQLLLQRE